MLDETHEEGAVSGEAEQPSFERELARLAATFISLRGEAIDAQIEHAVGLAADFLDIDRVTVGQRLRNTGNVRLTHQWVREGCPRIENTESYVPERAAPRTWAQAVEGKAVTFSKPDDLPEEAADDNSTIASTHAPTPFCRW
jgi:hypothetical protein